MLDTIKLVSSRAETVELKVNKDNKIYSVEEILGISKKVYDDVDYNLILEGDLGLSDIGLRINDEHRHVFCVDNKYIIQSNAIDNATFFGFFGNIRSVISGIDEKGEKKEYCSELANVLIKSTYAKNRNVDLMLKYIYDNQKSFLLANADVIGAGDNLDEAFFDFNSQINFLDSITQIYEKNAGFFKANRHYKLKTVEELEDIEKLKYIDSQSIQYMVQHPEYLRQSHIGIKYGRRTFLPEKTNMRVNCLTTDIYENQVVLGFLKKVLFDARELKDQIDKYLIISYKESPSLEIDGYIDSSYLIYKNAVEILKYYKGRIDEVLSRSENLYSMYERILPVSEYDCSVQPKPTAIFLSVPQYNQIYVAIIKWYRKTGYNLEREKLMLNFTDVSSIYETYVLVKLINQINTLGFELKHQYLKKYPSIKYEFYKKTINNTFVFERNEKKITLFYEPAIYDKNTYDLNKLGLYRNTNISMPEDWDEPKEEGHHYAPDYVIKYEYGNETRYLILDAKYSNYEKVKYIISPRIAYKYSFSIDTIAENEKIYGVGIIYGKINSESLMESIYHDNVERKVVPFFNLIPQSEEMTENEQSMNFSWMLHELMQ